VEALAVAKKKPDAVVQVNLRLSESFVQRFSSS
jgi:hypothetical protein